MSAKINKVTLSENTVSMSLSSITGTLEPKTLYYKVYLFLKDLQCFFPHVTYVIHDKYIYINRIIKKIIINKIKKQLKKYYNEEKIKKSDYFTADKHIARIYKLSSSHPRASHFKKEIKKERKTRKRKK